MGDELGQYWGRHYWADEIRLSQGQHTHKFYVTDTLDLKTEVVSMKKFMPLFTEKFINAFYSRCDASKIVAQGGTIVMQRVFVSDINHTASTFNFPIKDGKISYDGTVIKIHFKGQVHRVSVIRGYGMMSWILFDNEIVNYMLIEGILNCFYISNIYADDRSGLLFIDLKVFDTKFNLQIKFDYENNTVKVKAHSNGCLCNHKTMAEALDNLCDNTEDMIKRNELIYDNSMPDASRLLLDYCYKYCKCEKQLTRLITLYLVANDKNLLVRDMAYFHIMEQYEKEIGFKLSKDTMVAKYYFTKQG